MKWSAREVVWISTRLRQHFNETKYLQRNQTVKLTPYESFSLMDIKSSVTHAKFMLILMDNLIGSGQIINCIMKKKDVLKESK